MSRRPTVPTALVLLAALALPLAAPALGCAMGECPMASPRAVELEHACCPMPEALLASPDCCAAVEATVGVPAEASLAAQLVAPVPDDGVPVALPRPRAESASLYLPSDSPAPVPPDGLFTLHASFLI